MAERLEGIVDGPDKPRGNILRGIGYGLFFGVGTTGAAFFFLGMREPYFQESGAIEYFPDTYALVAGGVAGILGFLRGFFDSHIAHRDYLRWRDNMGKGSGGNFSPRRSDCPPWGPDSP